MITVVFIVAVVNLCLGFALAVWLEPDLLTDLPPGSGGAPGAVDANVPAAPIICEVAPISAVRRQEQLPAGWVALLASEGITTNSFVEATAHVVRLEVGQYREQLLAIESTARRWQAGQAADVVSGLAADFRRVNEAWLTRQAEIGEHLRGAEAQCVYPGTAEAIAAVLQTQSSRIHGSFRALDDLPPSSDPTVACAAVLAETVRLIALAHALRDEVHEALVVIVRAEQRWRDVPMTLQRDAVTGLSNRMGIEAFFFDWWREDPKRTRIVSVALLDLDGFSRLNEAWGAAVGDRILAAISQMVHDLLPNGGGLDCASRFGGQSLLVFFGDRGPRHALGTVERIRQALEQATWEYGGHEWTLSMSCAVVEAGPQDDTPQLFGRLKGMVAQAKQLGRNRTCVDEGEGPNIVAAPQFQVQGRVLRLGD